MKKRILIVDDEPTICWSLAQALSDEGHETQQASSAEEGLEAVEGWQPDLILLDVRLPGMSGLEAINELHARVPNAAIVVMTAFGDLETAVAAIRSNAFEYLTKPFELDAVIDVVDRAFRSQDQATDSESVGKDAGPPPAGMVGASPRMQEVFKQIAVAANCDVPVLVTGESGTGKELVSDAIHRHSQRGSGPFLPVCLAAMNENLIESELFGHVRGAFTGADQERRGVLEMADGGTVFLDEIGDVPLSVQVKLLRAIERREWIPVGDSRPRQGDFRIVAATHRPLKEMIKDGTFREDLYYRLAVFPIELPPLRDRLDDLEDLIQHFLSSMPGGEAKRVTQAAHDELASRRWSGNVRELKNVIEHAAVVARGNEIGPEHLSKPSQAWEETSGDLGTLEEATRTWAVAQLKGDADVTGLYERWLDLTEPPLLEAVLKETSGNRVAASAKLGIHRTTLRQKLRRHGLDDSKETGG